MRYLSVLSVFTVIVLSTASGASAETLTDDQAYERAHTVCYQKVFPYWTPKKGETINRENYVRTRARVKKIVNCMNGKGVPVVHDEENNHIVRDGSGFGKNVNIKVGELFPESLVKGKPVEDPHKTDPTILPDPGAGRDVRATKSQQAPSVPDEVDIRERREMFRKLGVDPNSRLAREGYYVQGKPETGKAADAEPEEERNTDATTGNPKDGRIDVDAPKPIFLRR